MKKWQIIDLARSFSILAVMAVHFQWIYRIIPNPISNWLWDHFQRNGAYGVYFFFVVSGFLITHVIAGDKGGVFKPDFRKFYTRRVGRILPLYVLVVAFGLTLYLVLVPRSWQVERFYKPGPGFDPAFWASIAVFCFNWLLFFRRPPILYYGQHWLVLWSLAIEEQFYLLFPLVLKKTANSKRLVFFLGLVILASVLWRGASYLLAPSYPEWPLCNSVGVFDLIALGVLLYLAVDRYGRFFSKNKGISGLTCTAGFVLMAVIYLFTSYDSPLDRIYASTALGVGLFAFLLGGLHLAFFESRYLAFAALPGKYCYGLYLIHSTLFCFIEPYYLKRLNTFAAFGAVLVVSTAVAAASYHFFEMPANRWVRKRLAR